MIESIVKLLVTNLNNRLYNPETMMSLINEKMDNPGWLLYKKSPDFRNFGDLGDAVGKISRAYRKGDEIFIEFFLKDIKEEFRELLQLDSVKITTYGAGRVDESTNEVRDFKLGGFVLAHDFQNS